MDPITLIAHYFGWDPAVLLATIPIVVIIANYVSRIIPDDQTGFLGIVKTVCKVIGLYASNKITAGITVTDVAKATQTVIPAVTEVAKLPNPSMPESSTNVMPNDSEKTGQATFKMILILAFASPLLCLTGCQTPSTAIPSSPGQIASQTVLDEKGAIALTVGYTAASRAAALAIRVGVVTDSTKIAKIGELDRKAFALVQAVHAAYESANAASYTDAFNKAQAAIAELLAAF